MKRIGIAAVVLGALLLGGAVAMGAGTSSQCKSAWTKRYMPLTDTWELVSGSWHCVLTPACPEGYSCTSTSASEAGLPLGVTGCACQQDASPYGWMLWTVTVRGRSELGCDGFINDAMTSVAPCNFAFCAGDEEESNCAWTNNATYWQGDPPVLYRDEECRCP